jgi:hypothetical protein
MYGTYGQKYVWNYEVSDSEVVELSVDAGDFRDLVGCIDAYVAGAYVVGRDLWLNEVDIQQRTKEVYDDGVIPHACDISVLFGTTELVFNLL